MCRISKWIKDCIHLFRDCRICRPYVSSRDDKVFCKCSIAVYADTFCIFTVLFVPFQTVTAFSAYNMSFSGYNISDVESFYARSHLYDLSNIFVSSCLSYGNGVLCPFIPLIDMYVCSTDCCLMDFDLHIVCTNFRNRYSF